MSDLIERVRAGGLLAPGRPVLVLLSGGRDSVCLLDLAVRIAGVAQVTALHCNYGLRDGGGRRRGVLRRAVRAARRPAPRPPAGARRRQPAGVGARRPLRRGARARGAATSPRGTPRPTRPRPCSTGSRPRPAGARCSGCASATGSSSGRCSASRARRPRPTAAPAGSTGSRTRATPTRPSRAGACAIRCCRRCARSIPRRRRTSCARWRCCATRRTCSTRSWAPRSPPPAIRRGPTRCARSRPRCSGSRVQRLAGDGPAIGHRTAEILALPEGGALDVGGGLRAEIRGGGAAVRREHGTRGAAASI